MIVGGHAAGLWSRYYLAMGVSSLAEFMPFRSKDLDLVGNIELPESIQRSVKGKIHRSEPPTPFSPPSGQVPTDVSGASRQKQIPAVSKSIRTRLRWQRRIIGWIEMGVCQRSVAGLIYRRIRVMVFLMVTLTEIESHAFKLPQSERAKLAADLLDSLPGVLDDEDEGLAEALRRSEEMDRDPSMCLSHDEFLKALGR